MRYAPGPHVKAGPSNAKNPCSHLFIRPLFGDYFHLYRFKDAVHSRVGKPLSSTEIREGKFRVKTASDLWETYLKAIEVSAEPSRSRNKLYLLSELGQLRTNRFLSLDDSAGSDRRLSEGQVKRLFAWDGQASGRLPIEARHHANYRVRDFSDFISEQFLGLIRYLQFRCQRIERELGGTNAEAALIARKLLSLKVMHWFERAARREPQFQILDDLNPCTARAHTRRLTFMGAGSPAATNRDSLPEHYDHMSDLGRVCPVDTPQGPRIGLNLFLASGAIINGKGLVCAPVTDASGSEHYLDVFAQCETAIQVGRTFSDTPTTCLWTDQNGIGSYRVMKPTHLLHPNSIISECTAKIPFLQHDDNNRALLGTNFLKQAIPILGGNPPKVSADINDLAHQSPRPKGWPSPEVTPFVTSHGTPYPESLTGWSLGADVWVAVMPWFGWSFEDGVVVSKDLVESNRFTHTELQLYTLNLSHLKHQFPFRDKSKSEKLDADGVIKVGVSIDAREPLVVYGSRNLAGKTEERKLVAPHWAQGHIKAVRVLYRHDGHALGEGIDVRIMIWVEETRSLEIGDKLANRHGGKGVICHIEETCRMPRFKVGDEEITAQVLVNPYSILGRKNIGQLAETACGLLPDRTEVQAFGAPTPVEIAKRLEAHGLQETTTIHFVNQTGKNNQLRNIAVGQQFFMKLDHSPHKKLNARGIGPHYNLMTGQPVGGRRNRGGQRLGEMEIWALVSHQAYETISELSVARSDSILPQHRKHAASRDAILSFKAGRQNFSSTMFTLWTHLQAAALNLHLISHDGELITWKQLTKDDPPRIDSFRLRRLSKQQFEIWSPLQVAEPLSVDGEGRKNAQRSKGTPNSERENLFHKSLLSESGDRWACIALDDLGISHPLTQDPMDFLPVLPWRFRKDGEDLERAFRTGEPQGWLNKRYESVLWQIGFLSKCTNDRDRAARRTRIQKSINRLFGVDGDKLLGDGSGKDKGLISGLLGKTGFIRSDCLRRRVDCSARATITLDPTLAPDEVRIPVECALALLEPLLSDSELLSAATRSQNPFSLPQRETLATQICKFLERFNPPLQLLLNRQPSLHRLSMQAFRFSAWEGRTIQIPAYCTAGLGADFDGDTVAIYLPTGAGSQRELRERLSPFAQAHSPANGQIAWAMGAEIGFALKTIGFDTEAAFKKGEHRSDESDRALALELSQWHQLLGSESISFGFSSIASGKSIDQISNQPELKPFLTSKSRRAINEMVTPSKTLPDRSTLAAGRTPLDFFAAEASARRGLMDKAFTTAPAGYMTRKLIYLMGNLKIVAEDCGDQEGLVIDSTHISQRDSDTLKSFLDSLSTLHETAVAHSNADLPIRLRTPLTCLSQGGVCKKCYGEDLARGCLPTLGYPVGFIAAQSIGERGTQLAMKTFHAHTESMDTSIDFMHSVIRNPKRALLDSNGKTLDTVSALMKLFSDCYLGQINMKHFALLLRARNWNKETPPPAINDMLIEDRDFWMAMSFERQLQALLRCVKEENPIPVRSDLAGIAFAVGRDHESRGLDNGQT
jgi:DNA-directed RNA polymerase subunit beta